MSINNTLLFILSGTYQYKIPASILKFVHNMVEVDTDVLKSSFNM